MPNGIEMKRHMTTHEEIWQKREKLRQIIKQNEKLNIK